MSGRPIANLSLAIDYAISALDSAGYHVTNIVLHIGCALLMFGFVRRTLQRVAPETCVPIAAISALLWAVHPLNSEVVDHISARTESLMAFCYLLTLYAADRARTASYWTGVSVFACAAGMACKESMVTAPLMVLLYDRAFYSQSWVSTLRTRRWLYTGLAATWIVFVYVNRMSPRGHATTLVADEGLIGPATPFTYALNQARLVPHYLRLAVWPTDLVLDYGMVRPIRMGGVAPFLVLLILGVALVLWLNIVKRRWGFLGAWFLVTLAPASSVVPVYTAVGAERRMYVPMMALTAAVVLAVFALMRRSLAASRTVISATALAVTVIGILAIATITRNAEYSTALTTWSTVVERWPHGRAHYNRAMALTDRGRRDEAISELRLAATDYPEALSVLGVTLIESGRADEGISTLQAFIRLRPDHINVVNAHVRIADALFAQEKYAAAIPEYRAYLGFQPQAVRAWTNFGICLAATENPREAVAAFRRAVVLQPGQRAARRS